MKIEEYRSITAYIKALETATERMDYLAGIVGGNRPIISKIEALKAVYSDEIERARAWQHEIIKAIDSLSDEDCRAVIRLKVIDGMTHEQIADTLCYAPNTIIRKYKKAMAEVRA